MSSENILPSTSSKGPLCDPTPEGAGLWPSAPPLDRLVAPGSKSLSHSLLADTGDFKLKKICDCQKQLKNEISHYQQVANQIRVSEECLSHDIFNHSSHDSSSVDR